MNVTVNQEILDTIETVLPERITTGQEYLDPEMLLRVRCLSAPIWGL